MQSKTKPWEARFLCLVCALAFASIVVGCGDDNDTSSGDSDTDTDTDTDTDIDTDIDADTDADTDADGDTDSDSDSDTGPDGDFDLAIVDFDWLEDGMIFHESPTLEGADTWVSFSPHIQNNGDEVTQVGAGNFDIAHILDGAEFDRETLGSPVAAGATITYETDTSVHLERAGVGEHEYCMKIDSEVDSNPDNDEFCINYEVKPLTDVDLAVTIVEVLDPPLPNGGEIVTGNSIEKIVVRYENVGEEDIITPYFSWNHDIRFGDNVSGVFFAGWDGYPVGWGWSLEWEDYMPDTPQEVGTVFQVCVELDHQDANTENNLLCADGDITIVAE